MLSLCIELEFESDHFQKINCFWKLKKKCGEFEGLIN